MKGFSKLSGFIGGCCAVILGLMVAAMPQAQDQACSPAIIRQRMTTLLELYQANQNTDPLVAAERLRDGIDTIVNECDPPLAVSSVLMAGKWQIVWEQETVQCADGTSFNLIDGAVIVEYQDEQNSFTLDSGLGDPLRFSLVVDGVYGASRNFELFDGTPYTYSYRAFIESPMLIGGSRNLFLPNKSCNILSGFTIELENTSIICMVVTPTGANLRVAPDTDSERAGILRSLQPRDVVGQILGADGFVWWGLIDGVWVRADVVEEAGACDRVPTLTLP